ncbi:hypothetical protein [Neptuniibacter sp. QD37_11]|uniref:hypothetical protein n=1 Tax=Neptuniibacter sp. QD37_11 TaxID=3398209 RepID=UPI0039F59AD1
MAKPTFNTETGKWEVGIFREKREFDTQEEAQEHSNHVNDWIFSDPIFCTD